MKVAKAEFDKFYDEVLGNLFYVDDDDMDCESNPVIVEAVALAYQGPGKCPPKSRRHSLITDKEYDALYEHHILGVSLLTLFKRWRKAQKTSFILVQFAVPLEQADDLKEKVSKMGGKILVPGVKS